MKVFVVVAALVAVATAQYDYTPPQRQFNAGSRPVYGPPQNQPEPTEAPYVPQIFKHVYVHSVPDEPTEVQNKVIRVPGGDKHVNIIFVKAPSQSTSQQTEVILPDQDEHKNLVYVLLKKGENTNDVKIRGPPPARPQKPEVYFIRYKNEETQQPQYGAPAPPPQQNYGGPQAPAPSAPTPVRNIPAPRDTYGTPF